MSSAVTQLNQLLFRACATSTDSSTMSPCSLVWSLHVILLALEKWLSDSTDDAGITKIFTARFVNSSNLNCACKNYKNQVRHRVCHSDPWPDPTGPDPNIWPGDPVTRRHSSNTALELCQSGCMSRTFHHLVGQSSLVNSVAKFRQCHPKHGVVGHRWGVEKLRTGSNMAHFRTDTRKGWKQKIKHAHGQKDHQEIVRFGGGTKSLKI